MTSASALEKGDPIPQSTVQESILQQAQAAAAAQTDPSNPARQETLFNDRDLLTPDGFQDDAPPPAYGDIYGEIRSEKSGMGTTARVTADGRVDIRINNLNRRVSQIFTPVLRQQLEDVESSSTPASHDIATSPKRDRDALPAPPMNIVVQVVGSRGDVQPFVALGKVLKNTYGHRVRLATHSNFEKLVRENGLEFFSIGGDPAHLMAFMVKNPGLMPGFRSLVGGDVSQQRRNVAEYVQGCWRSCYQAGDGMADATGDEETPTSSSSNSGSEPAAKPFVADCIIANPPSFAHIHCAEKLGVPLHIMFTMPYSPTQAFPHPLANVQSSNADPQLGNYMSYALIELLSWQGLSDIINRFRAKCLGLDPVSLIWGPGMLQRLKVTHTYCWSPALIPKPKDWAPHISITGFNFLTSDYTPTPDLQAFLDAGPPPVYIGFGSIVLDDPIALTKLIFEAVTITGQRALLSKGWGGIGTQDLPAPQGVFMLGNVPHDWLFEHVSCVVHHGGAGTTAAGLAAGRPTTVVPFFGDQPFWGAMVARAGAGPKSIPYKQLTSENLADAINFCLTPASLERAKELGFKIAAERGNETSAQSFHQHIKVDRLRCTLVPSRPAAWRIKRTRITLSPFAACTLANANLLDFGDLKLFRPQEYYTDEGPFDPISGGFTAFVAAVNGMAAGLIETPTETWKALRMPYTYSRQQSGSSVARDTSRSESVHAASSGQKQAGLKAQEPMSGSQSADELSGRSTPTSLDDSGSKLSARGGKPGEMKEDRVRSHGQGNRKKERDMMRAAGPHTSKGLGRSIGSLVQAPVNIAVNLTQGAHNLPKLWGDNSVRPQERVGDFKTGMQAVGREFGLGWYDGLTGLVTQPWRGAQESGAGGFVKGIGKGFGGFFTKLTAAHLGILSHTMKGVHKEVQRLFSKNAQSYIAASRAAQGYEDWLTSSDAEKEDVIARWKLIQKYQKKREMSHEALADILEEQWGRKAPAREVPQNDGHPAEPYKAPAGRSASPALSADGSRSSLRLSSTSSQDSLVKARPDGAARRSLAKTPQANSEGDSGPMRTTRESVSQPQRLRQTRLDHAAEEEEDHWRQVIVASKAEAQQSTEDDLTYEKQLEQAMAQSLEDLGRQMRCGDESNMLLSDDSNRVAERAGALNRKAVGTANLADDALTVQRPAASSDPGHLAGTTRSEFEVQQQGEKTARERTEEEIVMEYVRKQSLLEMRHLSESKGRAVQAEEDSDQHLQTALDLSMQDGERGEKDQSGQPSRTT